MELRVLNYFLTVAREGNVTRASQLLHITQPTLSRQLMQLEDELGTALFVRGKRKMILTEDGMILKRRAEEIIELAKKTQQEIGYQNYEVSGEITIGCGLTEATNTLGKYIEQFHKVYPQVSFHIRNGNSDLTLENIDNGLIDIGLVLEPVELEKLNFIRIKEKERWGLLINKDSPLAKKDYLTVQDLIGIPLINTTRLQTQNFFKDWAGEYYDQLELKTSAELTTSSSILVKRRIGSAITIEGSISNINTDELCFKLFYPELSTYSLIVWKKYQSFSLTVSRFIDFLLENKFI